MPLWVRTLAQGFKSRKPAHYENEIKWCERYIQRPVPAYTPRLEQGEVRSFSRFK